MRNLRWSLAGLFVCGLPTACADPCIDDGLGQADCPSQSSASDTEGATESNTNTNTVTDTMGTATMSTATVGMTGSQSATDGETMGTLDGTATQGETATETEGSTLWCVDADGDGFGDPDMCQQSNEPIPGSVNNDDDCDDGNENTFPGAAELDDRRACMKDDDDDGWGDTDPPPGVEPGTDCLDDNANVHPGAAYNEDPPDLCAEDEDGDGWGDIDPPRGADPGTDCDDTNPSTFPGAAFNEMPPGQCMQDEDGDGWGDANPPGGGGGGGGGPVGGADCYDQNPDLNPDTLQLTVITPFQGGAAAPRAIETVDPLSAALTPFVTLLNPMGGTPNVNLVTATLGDGGEIYANDLTTVQLYSIDYATTCLADTGELAPVGMGSYGVPGTIVCGLEFGPDGALYGVDHGNALLTFDPATGQITNSVPITLMGATLNISSCGTAIDCSEGRLLVANGIDQSIYSIDTTGEATLLRNLASFLPGAWSPVGLEWNPVSRLAYLSTGPALYEVDLDDVMAPPTFVGFYGENASNLQYLPLCL